MTLTFRGSSERGFWNGKALDLPSAGFPFANHRLWNTSDFIDHSA